MVEWKSEKVNVPTSNASLTRLFLDSLDLNARASNTGTATPQRLRHTEPQRSADLARKRAIGMPREQRLMMHDANERRPSNILLYTGYSSWCKLDVLCRHTSCTNSSNNTLIDPILFFAT